MTGYPTARAGALAALEVRGLSHAYGRNAALEAIGFSVPAGSFTVLIGANGAGKTTLLSLLTRTLRVQAGAIVLFGFDLNRQPSQCMQRLGVVFQQRSLDLDLTVAQNLRYHAALHGISRSEANRRITEELARAGLTELEQRKVREVSGGQARRVEIARALLHRPGLLLLDEPTTSLDSASRRRLRGYIHEMCNTGVSVVWATHLFDEIDGDCRVIVLEKGRILADCEAPELLRRTGAPDYQAALQAVCGEPLTEQSGVT